MPPQLLSKSTSHRCAPLSQPCYKSFVESNIFSAKSSLARGPNPRRRATIVQIVFLKHLALPGHIPDTILNLRSSASTMALHVETRNPQLDRPEGKNRALTMPRRTVKTLLLEVSRYPTFNLTPKVHFHALHSIPVTIDPHLLQ